MSDGDVAGFGIQVSDFPTKARQELARIGVQIDAVTKLDRGWDLSLSLEGGGNHLLGDAVATLAHYGVRIYGIDSTRPRP